MNFSLVKHQRWARSFEPNTSRVAVDEIQRFLVKKMYNQQLQFDFTTDLWPRLPRILIGQLIAYDKPCTLPIRFTIMETSNFCRTLAALLFHP